MTRLHSTIDLTTVLRLSGQRIHPVFIALCAGFALALASAAAIAQDASLAGAAVADDELVAKPGRHRSTFVGETVLLDGAQTTRGRDGHITWQWTLIDKPAHSVSELHRATTPAPFLFVDREGVYVVELVVKDGHRVSEPARVVISTPRPALSSAVFGARTVNTRAGLDADGDGIADDLDNCINVANPDQRDTDSDLFGNACDADFNNDGIVNVVDLGVMRLAFFGTPVTDNWNPDTDLNGDNSTNVIDLGRLRQRFFGVPGPSGLLPQIMCGDLISGTIDEPNDGDFYVLSLSAGQVVALAVGQSAGFAGSAARATIYAPDGTGFSNATAQSQDVFTAPATGLYQVVIRAANSAATGSYRIGLICVSPPAPVVSSLSCGDLHADTIDTVSEADLYTFDANAGDVLAVTMTQSAGFAGTAARGQIFSPTGDFIQIVTAQSQDLFTAPQTGTYVLKVAAANFFATGSYAVGITCLNPVNPAATALGCGDLVADTIEAVGDADVFTFDAGAGDTLAITMAQSSGFPGAAARAQVYAPDGQFLTTLTAQSQTQFDAPEAGTYVMKVAASNFFATGSYAVGISCLLPVDPQAVALNCGDNLAGTIDAVGDADIYTFDAQAGDELAITMAQETGFAGTAARLQLFSPSGQFLTTFTAQSQDLFTAPETGTYVMKVAAANFFATGTYRVGVTCINPAGPVVAELACGVPFASTIGQTGEADIFTFDAQAGDELTMILAQSAGFAGSAARAQLFSPDGQFLVTYTAQSQDLFTAPDTGTYVLKVAAANFFATGSYSVGKVCIFPTAPVIADIACNTVSSSSIDEVGESDLFTFTAGVGDDRSISITQTAGFGGSVARVRLFSPSGQFIATYTANSTNGFVPTQSGTHILRMAAANIVATGAYDLGVTCN